MYTRDSWAARLRRSKAPDGVSACATASRCDGTIRRWTGVIKRRDLGTCGREQSSACTLDLRTICHEWFKVLRFPPPPQE
eukprot:6188150-Pleurochrysis_carterae.AAC.1